MQPQRLWVLLLLVGFLCGPVPLQQQQPGNRTRLHLFQMRHPQRALRTPLIGRLLGRLARLSRSAERFR